MLLVDTSVWIDLLSRKPSFRIAPEQLFQLCVCPPIVQELLQGLPVDGRYEPMKESIMALPCVNPTISLEMFVKAGEIYRVGRRRGRTIRSSIDCLIAVIAMENKITVWHKDRDFDVIASYTDLLVTKSP